jgi:KDO2-lipid IV(A) lauroyltransferase
MVMLAPHFVGLDAGGSALTQVHGVHMASIYVRQRNAALDEWVRQGRNRSGQVSLYFRHQVKKLQVQYMVTSFLLLTDF